MIRVAIVASGMAMRVGLRQVVGSLPGVEIVAESGLVANLPPADVLVLASIELLPHAEVLPASLLISDDPQDALRLAQLPVWGILPLETGEKELEAAIRALAQGLCVGAPSLLADFLPQHPGPAVDDTDLTANPLTGRESEILQLAAEGLANKQIGLALSISEHTVKFHLSAIYAKLGATSRTEAIRAGARRGLVTL